MALPFINQLIADENKHFEANVNLNRNLDLQT